MLQPNISKFRIALLLHHSVYVKRKERREDRRTVKFVRNEKNCCRGSNHEDQGRETFRSPFGPAPPTHLPDGTGFSVG